jgi:hypothetical protein
MVKCRTTIYRMAGRRKVMPDTRTPAERIGLVWPLTREVASLSKKHNVEQRLQRHVTRLIRREDYIV